MKEKPNLIIAGGTGYLGGLLAEYFKSRYNIIILTRNPINSNNNILYLNWNDNWQKRILSSTVVINLAGKSINCLFTKKNKHSLIQSRLKTTKAINIAIKNAKNPPELFINTSGISIYKSSYHANYDEINYEYGTDFLSILSQKWEKEFYKTETHNTRKVAIRLAPVLGKNSKAIKQLIPIVKLGFGGKQGNGKQIFPFIHQTDFVLSIKHIIENATVTNSVNLVSPTPTTNAEFMEVFRQLLNVKIGIPTPSFILNLSKYFTKIEPQIILTSLYAKPNKLLNSGYQFTFKDISSALSEILQSK
jgi:uncharacterized protein (TIGR01777 family)